MIYNLSTEKEYTIRAYAKKICDILDYDHKKIVYDTNKFVGVRSKRLEPNIKYEPTNIDFVIKEMIEYYEGKINE
jgi:nucleoside-diphosphate-sugar epimerase